MADNTDLLPGTGGDTIRDVQKGAGPKTQVVIVDMGGGGAEDIATLPASSAKQDTGNTSIASIDTKTPALGQALAAASTPVVLTAAQVTTLTPPAAITGFALEAGNLATIAAKDFATSVKQDTGNTSLSSIDGKTPVLGQALAAASSPVVLTAAQMTTLTPPAAIVGFALEAGHLAAIDTSVAKIPAQGQALAAASMPVVLTAAQVTTLTPPAAITGFALETGGNLATIASAVKAEDSLAVDLDKGIPSLAVRQDVPTTDTSMTMDYSFVKTDAQGRVWINSDVLAGYMRTQNELLADVRTELKILNANTSSIGNVRDDLDSMRSDPYYNQ